MKKLKITVVTPSYNQGEFIQDTIKSVLNQDYNELEYFVIDGGSKDGTIEIIKKYERQLTYWVSEKDNGQTHAINKGFKRATGDIIAWINSDDAYCQGALKAVSEYFESNPRCHWLAGNLLFMDKQGEVYIRKYPNSSRWLERNCMMSIYQPNIFLKRSILNEFGYPREDFHMTMDFEWFCRIAQKYPIHIINKDIAKFRLHSDSKSSSHRDSLNQKIYHKEAIKIIRRLHPGFSWFIDKYPKMTFSIWFNIGKLMRMLVRIKKMEFRKLRDTKNLIPMK